MRELQSGGFIVWFAHYGSIDHEYEQGPLEDIVDWVAGMDEEDTCQYDQHGIPLDVERIGAGIVEDFHDMVDARRAERDKERKAQAEQWAEERERQRAENPGPRYILRLKPPEHVGPGLARYGVAVATGLTNEQAIAERDRLAALFGEDRVSVQEQK